MNGWMCCKQVALLGCIPNKTGVYLKPPAVVTHVTTN